MPSFNKIKLKSFVFSFILSSILTLLIFFTLQSFSVKLSGDIILFTFSALGIVTFTLIYLYLKFVIENRIKDIYKSIIPENDSIENKLVSTDMEDLIQQLKTFSKENMIEIKSMQEKENFRRNFIGNLAHELKTPLFTSQSYLLTLIDGAVKDKIVNSKLLYSDDRAV
jgi:two-component system phosphate regulon sensor histidine kinase PhoR